jgi:hypothetical protein
MHWGLAIAGTGACCFVLAHHGAVLDLFEPGRARPTGNSWRAANGTSMSRWFAVATARTDRRHALSIAYTFSLLTSGASRGDDNGLSRFARSLTGACTDSQPLALVVADLVFLAAIATRSLAFLPRNALHVSRLLARAISAELLVVLANGGREPTTTTRLGEFFADFHTG